MNARNPRFRVQRVKWQVLGSTSLLITLLVVYFHLFRNVSQVDSIFGWLISNLIAWFVIGFSFRRVEYFQTQLTLKVSELEAQAQRNAALVRLSENLAASLDESEVCQKLVEDLRSIQGYDFVSVFMFDQGTGNRKLAAEYTRSDIGSSPILKPGEGLSERAILDGKLHYTPDITLESSHVPGSSTGSEIDAPVQFNGETMGVIVVESHEIDAFNKNDFDLLTLAADQAAQALKNVRLYSIEKTRRKHAEILQRATTTLASALEINKVLEEILDQLRQVIAHDSACIFIWEGDSVQALAARGLPNMEEVVGYRFPASDELFQLVLTNRHAIILDDIENDPRYKGWGGTHQTQSWMGVPLIAYDNVIGYLTLDSLKPKAYNESHTNLAQIFANQAAVAIENARLYRKAKDSSDRQVILHQISQDIIRAEMNLEQIYILIHKAAAKLMPADAFVISMLDESADEIEAVYLFDKNKRESSTRLARGQGLSGHIIETGKPVLAFDYLNQEELREVKVAHFGSDEHIRSLLAVPMLLGDKVIGMISAQTYTPYDYSEEDQKLLDMLAAYAAIAINNAQLFSEVQHMAITDSLTGAYNRRYFFNIAQNEITRANRYGHSITLMMIDLDFFKEINDAHGHAIGDQALKLIVQCFTKKIRNTDTLARYGGDEFVILLPQTDITQGQEIAERLRTHFEENAINVDGIPIKITISVGISGSQGRSPQLNTFLKYADIALYNAKASGRNCVQILSCPRENQTSETPNKSKGRSYG